MQSSHISSSVILHTLNAAASEARAASELNLFPIVGAPTLHETLPAPGFLTVMIRLTF